MSAPAAVLFGGPHDGHQLPHVPERAARIFVTPIPAPLSGRGPGLAVVGAGAGAHPDNPRATVYTRTGRTSGDDMTVYEYTPLVPPLTPT